MARSQLLLKRFFPRSRALQQASSTIAAPPAAVEVLENRRLLSASAGSAVAPIAAPTPIAPIATAARGYGVTLELTAGQNFDGYLGDLVGVKVPASFKVSASINWGDGTNPSAGVVSISSAHNIDVGGSHTYANSGKFIISITVTATPAPIVLPTATGAAASTGVVSDPIILFLGRIQSLALVSPSGGVTINEQAGVAFTANVGTFSYIAPGTNLQASIDWGDGTAPSAGTITPTGVSGLDVINYSVAGSHTYASVGTYPIVITITKSGPTGSASPTQIITTIDSTADVTAAGLDLDGTITGTLSPAPTAFIIGALYLVKGTGSLAAMGPVSATGRIQLPPLTTAGPVTGSLTLDTIGATPGGPSGTVTLALTAPPQAASNIIPAVLNYVITSGTGNFADATGAGAIDVTLSSLDFTFVLNSASGIATPAT